MTGWIRAGTRKDDALPMGSLTRDEQQDLLALLEARAAAASQVATIERSISLLVLTARDRRGLSGEVQVNPSTGEIGPHPGGDDAGR